MNFRIKLVIIMFIISRVYIKNFDFLFNSIKMKVTKKIK
jgi:hypothetical protein